MTTLCTDPNCTECAEHELGDEIIDTTDTTPTEPSYLKSRLWMLLDYAWTGGAISRSEVESARKAFAELEAKLAAAEKGERYWRAEFQVEENKEEPT